MSRLKAWPERVGVRRGRHGVDGTGLLAAPDRVQTSSYLEIPANMIRTETASLEEAEAMLASGDAKHTRRRPPVPLFYDGLELMAAAGFARAAYSRGRGAAGYVYRNLKRTQVWTGFYTVFRSNQSGFARLFVVPLALCLLAEIASAEDAGRAGTGGSFFDHFATLDPDRWLVSDGWSNGAHQNCTWSVDNIRAAKHSLELLLTNQPSGERPFTCGELQTKEFYGYGTYEVRMRAAAAPGVVTAFFTYTGPPHGAGKPHDEVDFEFLGKDAEALQLNYFINGQGNHLRIITFDFSTTTTVNDYAFEWMPDSLRWFVNGRLVHEVKKGPDEPLPTNPGKIYLSIWTGKGRDTEAWLGSFEYSGVPVVATYEYVAFTEAGKACRFPTSIVCTRGTSRF